jgi:protein tyrosine/serine phosphatase
MPTAPSSTRPLLLALLILAPGCASRLGRRDVAGVPNFGTVTENGAKLYRGAQPTPVGLQTLRQEKQVAAIVNLRRTGDAVDAERRHIESMNASAADGSRIEFISIPSSCSPSTADLKHFVLEMRRLSAQGKPVFVHCKHGKDRTGLFVAVYEMVELNKPRKDALANLKGFGHAWPVCQEIDAYLNQFDPGQFRERLNHP